MKKEVLQPIHYSNLTGKGTHRKLTLVLSLMNEIKKNNLTPNLNQCSYMSSAEGNHRDQILLRTATKAHS